MCSGLVLQMMSGTYFKMCCIRWHRSVGGVTVARSFARVCSRFLMPSVLILLTYCTLELYDIFDIWSEISRFLVHTWNRCWLVDNLLCINMESSLWGWPSHAYVWRLFMHMYDVYSCICMTLFMHMYDLGAGYLKTWCKSFMGDSLVPPFML